jgi:signal peptidase I
MEPTLSTGDIVLTEHVTPRFGQMNRGDIIVARSPRKPSDYICKRIIAVGGDVLECNRVDGTFAPVSLN